MNNPLTDILTSSPPYALVKKDAVAQNVSHCYLVFSEDEEARTELLSLLGALLSENGAGGRVGQKPKAEEIRELVGEIETPSIFPGRRVFLMPYFDTFSPICQNMLLKEIEEPPAEVCLLLGASGKQNVLETISSRAKKLTIPPFPDAELLKIITAAPAFYTPEATQIALINARGSYTRARKLLSDQKYIDRFRNICGILKLLTSSRDIASLDVGLPRDGETAKEAVNIFETIFALALEINTGRKSAEGDLADIAEKFPVAALANMPPLTQKARARLQANCGAQAVFDELLFDILEVKYKTRA